MKLSIDSKNGIRILCFTKNGKMFYIVPSEDTMKFYVVDPYFIFDEIGFVSLIDATMLVKTRLGDLK